MELPYELFFHIVGMMELSPKEMSTLSLIEKAVDEHFREKLLIAKWRHLVLPDLRKTIDDGTNEFIQRRRQAVERGVSNPPKDYVSYWNLVFRHEMQQKFDKVLGLIKVRLSGEHCCTYASSNSLCLCCEKAYFNEVVSRNKADPSNRRLPRPCYRDYHCSIECYQRSLQI